MAMMPGDDVLTEPVARRIEVFTGAGRRRKWSPEAKARIVAESYALSVGDVADRYGLAKTQVFTWRRGGAGEAGASGRARSNAVRAGDHRASGTASRGPPETVAQTCSPRRRWRDRAGDRRGGGAS